MMIGRDDEHEHEHDDDTQDAYIDRLTGRVVVFPYSPLTIMAAIDQADAARAECLERFGTDAGFWPPAALDRYSTRLRHIGEMLDANDIAKGGDCSGSERPET